MKVCTSNCMVCRAIIDSLPEENLNSLVISLAFRQGLSQRTIQIFRGQLIRSSLVLVLITRCALFLKSDW